MPDPAPPGARPLAALALAVGEGRYHVGARTLAEALLRAALLGRATGPAPERPVTDRRPRPRER